MVLVVNPFDFVQSAPTPTAKSVEAEPPMGFQTHESEGASYTNESSNDLDLKDISGVHRNSKEDNCSYSGEELDHQESIDLEMDEEDYDQLEQCAALASKNVKKSSLKDDGMDGQKLENENIKSEESSGIRSASRESNRDETETASWDKNSVTEWMENGTVLTLRFEKLTARLTAVMNRKVDRVNTCTAIMVEHQAKLQREEERIETTRDEVEKWAHAMANAHRRSL